jgi:hypothetical protein
MSFLYGETEPPRSTELRSHLAECAACSSKVKTWRASMKALDQWPAESAAQPGFRWMPVLKVAAAVALLVAVGFGLGRVSSREGSGLAAMRAELAHDFERKLELARSNLAEQLQRQQREAIDAAMTETLRAAITDSQGRLADYAASAETARLQDYETVLAGLRRIDTAREADYASLRKELETVAVLTQAGFQNLVAQAQPASAP